MKQEELKKLQTMGFVINPVTKNGITVFQAAYPKTKNGVSPALDVDKYETAEEFLEGFKRAQLEFQTPKIEDFIEEIKKPENWILSVESADNEPVEDAIFREVLNLRVYVRAKLNINGRGATTILKESMLDTLEVEESFLWEKAYENTSEEIEIQSMLDVLKSKLELIDDEDIDVDMFSTLNEPKMFVVTNKSNFLGASSILFKDALQEAARRMETDSIYIIPSSIHEVIAVDAHETDPRELIKLNAEVNLTEVSPLEVLCNCIYKYNAVTNELIIV